MFRKTIFIAVVVILVFLIYRGISPSGADKVIDKISSVREKNIAKIQSWNTITWNIISSWKILSWEDSFEKLVQSGSIIWITGEKITSTWNTNTWTINTWNTTKPTTKPVIKKPTTKPIQPTNTNWLSQQDMNDLKALLNNIVE